MHDADDNGGNGRVLRSGVDENVFDVEEDDVDAHELLEGHQNARQQDGLPIHFDSEHVIPARFDPIRFFDFHLETLFFNRLGGLHFFFRHF